MVGRPHHLRIVIDVERIDFHTFNYIMDPLPMYNKNVGVVWLLLGKKYYIECIIIHNIPYLLQFQNPLPISRYLGKYFETLA